MTTCIQSYDADVVVVGSGPSGTFLANLLGQAGLSCVLIEKRLGHHPSSMAIGVMPPSLQRLAQLGLADSVVRAGCPVTRASTFSETELLGTLDLTVLPPPFNFILSIPQSSLVRLLRDKLQAWPRVSLLLGREVQSVTQTGDGVRIEARDGATGSVTALTARFAVACDGSRSPVRACVGIPFEGKAYAPSFVMGDFPETTPWAGEARFFFTPTGSIESFPLPGSRRRWVIQADSAGGDAGVIARRVGLVTGVVLDAARAEGVTTFTPERYVCGHYFNGRVALCGDAAHVMSPIGGQGMNTGLADAWHLAAVLKRLCETGEPPGRLLARYELVRVHAFYVAADRAARGMWLGTHKGRLAGFLRCAFIRRILFGTTLRHRLAPHFAMLTIPDYAPF